MENMHQNFSVKSNFIKFILKLITAFQHKILAFNGELIFFFLFKILIQVDKSYHQVMLKFATNVCETCRYPTMAVLSLLMKCHTEAYSGGHIRLPVTNNFLRALWLVH